MIIGERFPKDDVCPICRTNDNKKCVLIAIAGTQEGNNVQAQAFHLDCIDLAYYTYLPRNVILQTWKK